jgi:hypothetical protein
MTYSTLEEAWKAFAADVLDPLAPAPGVRNSMEIAFYMGAAALYMAISEARKSEDPMERMQHLFDEMDFYMQSVTKRSLGVDSSGHA